GWTLAILVADTAVVARNATLAPGCLVRHGAVIGPMAVVGENTVISDQSYVGHDTVVGADVYIAPGVQLNGSVSVGDHVFIGTGAVVLPGRRIGRNAVVGASACVTLDVPDTVTVVGVPARSPGPRSEAPAVTVTMATHNHEKYVGDAIRSVLAQTFTDFELVVIDDGSTDGTAAVIRGFDDPRIRPVFFDENHGMVFTKRKCLELARGRYVAVFNSDDLFHPEKLEKQVDYLEHHPDCGAILTLAEVIDDDGAPFADEHHPYYRIFDQPNRTRHEWLRRFFYDGNCLCMPSALIRRESYDAAGWPDPRLFQLPDLDFWIRLCLFTELHVLQRKLTSFRVRSRQANASGGTPEQQVREHWEYSRILRHYLTIRDQDELVRIFPEAQRFLNPYFALEPLEIAFVVAQLAAAAGVRQRAFALDTLFALLADPADARKLHERFHYGYREFIGQTGTLDPFRIGELDRLRRETGATSDGLARSG
ncbi:MAG: glycosyltransferase, partial [Acidobacteriota bacterium]|nr:glycosyltransferase [Acidobacteriota bacterium]